MKNLNVKPVDVSTALIQEIKKEGSPWLKVYFESGVHADFIGIFPEYMYNQLLPYLENKAKEQHMYVTESYLEGIE